MKSSISFRDWEPIYTAILTDLGFDRADDEVARDVAAELARPFAHDQLARLTDGRVAIAGAAPSLAAELAQFDPSSVDAIVAASTAADVLIEAGFDVYLMVTDLDKNVQTACDLTHRGIPVAAHAHGDNIPALREWLPQFDLDETLVTTQAAPRGAVENFGGFTDGDRAAFIADAFGAAELRFLGWDFDDSSVDPMKARKLRWAEHLLYWLEQRRDEQFDILDGRRASLSTTLSAVSTSEKSP